jgi:hypothetical protein
MQIIGVLSTFVNGVIAAATATAAIILQTVEIGKDVLALSSLQSVCHDPNIEGEINHNRKIRPSCFWCYIMLLITMYDKVCKCTSLSQAGDGSKTNCFMFGSSGSLQHVLPFVSYT